MIHHIFLDHFARLLRALSDQRAPRLGFVAVIVVVVVIAPVAVAVHVHGNAPVILIDQS